VRVSMPPSLNSAYHNAPGRGRVLSKVAKAWKKSHDDLIALSLRRFDCPVVLELTYHLGTGFRGDLSNRIKFAEDALVQAAVITDDKHSVVRGHLTRIGEPTGRSDSELTIRVIRADDASLFFPSPKTLANLGGDDAREI